MLGRTTKRQETGSAPPPEGAPASVISRDMKIVGVCSTDGPLRIDGTVAGDVKARSLELTRTGSVTGDVSAAGPESRGAAFLIDGSVDGSVRAASVEVGPNGAVASGLVATDAVVHGRVRGGIVARNRLSLEDTAVVEGDVRAARLGVKEGGRLNGTLRVRADGSGPEAADDRVAREDAARPPDRGPQAAD